MTKPKTTEMKAEPVWTAPSPADPNDDCQFCPHRGYEHSRENGACLVEDCACDVFIPERPQEGGAG